jgi:hypothetical protein
MNEERKKILSMLAEGRISTEEAEALLDSVASRAHASTEAGGKAPPANPKYLRVVVEGDHGPHGGKVNVRVPFNLIRAGIRLAALLPSVAHEPINRALKENGLNIDVSKVRPEDLEELVQHLSELSVDGNGGEKIRVFCE